MKFKVGDYVKVKSVSEIIEIWGKYDVDPMILKYCDKILFIVSNNNGDGYKAQYVKGNGYCYSSILWKDWMLEDNAYTVGSGGFRGGKIAGVKAENIIIDDFMPSSFTDEALGIKMRHKTVFRTPNGEMTFPDFDEMRKAYYRDLGRFNFDCMMTSLEDLIDKSNTKGKKEKINIMKNLRIGNVVKIKSDGWYNAKKNAGGIVIPPVGYKRKNNTSVFDKDKSDRCGVFFVITGENKEGFTLSSIGGHKIEGVWTSWMFEDGVYDINRRRLSTEDIILNTCECVKFNGPATLLRRFSTCLFLGANKGDFVSKK